MASKIQKQMIAINLKRGNLKLACYLALVANMESGNQVYLENAYAEVSSQVTPHQWAGYLAALQKDGKYRPQGDKFFGTIVK